MIPVLLATLLAQPFDTPPDQDRPNAEGIAPFARLRGGLWTSGGFEFEAVTSTGKREIDGRALWSAGADVGLSLDDRWLVIAGGEFATANDVTATTFSLSLGYRMRPKDFLRVLPPFGFELSAGVLWGEFDVDKTDFGDFDPAFGVRAGVDILFDLGPNFALGAYVEVRWIRFEYEETVLEGDEHAGGGGVAVGLTFEARW